MGETPGGSSLILRRCDDRVVCVTHAGARALVRRVRGRSFLASQAATHRERSASIRVVEGSSRTMLLDFVLFLLQPSLYLLFSSLCQLQFQMLYEYLVFYLADGKNNPALAPLAQFFENASNNLQKVLGKPSSMRFDLTHVILVSLLLSSIVGFEKLRLIVEEK